MLQGQLGLRRADEPNGSVQALRAPRHGTMPARKNALRHEASWCMCRWLLQMQLPSCPVAARPCSLRRLSSCAAGNVVHVLVQDTCVPRIQGRNYAEPSLTLHYTMGICHSHMCACPDGCSVRPVHRVRLHMHCCCPWGATCMAQLKLSTQCRLGNQYQLYSYEFIYEHG